jgi:predicted nucleic acid-binding protein
MIVPDANILVGWALGGHPLAERCGRLWALDGVWVVPRLWRYELWSVLSKMVWAKFLRPVDAEPLYQSLLARLCDNEQDPPASAVFSLTARHHVSAYDATYIALADLFDVYCVTEDRELLHKFPARALSLDAMLAGR